jgi:hypothetical protein
MLVTPIPNYWASFGMLSDSTPERSTKRIAPLRISSALIDPRSRREPLIRVGALAMVTLELLD